MKDEFHKRLTNIIQESGYSKYRIAKVLSISSSTVANYENGVTNPDKTKVEALCKFLSIDINWLYGGEGEKYMIAETSPDYKKADKSAEERSLEDHIRKLALSIQGQENLMKEIVKTNTELKEAIISLARRIEK